MGRFLCCSFFTIFSGPRSDTMQTLIGLALVGVLSGSVFGLPRVPPKEKGKKNILQSQQKSSVFLVC